MHQRRIRVAELLAEISRRTHCRRRDVVNVTFRNTLLFQQFASPARLKKLLLRIELLNKRTTPDLVHLVSLNCLQTDFSDAEIRRRMIEDFTCMHT